MAEHHIEVHHYRTSIECSFIIVHLDMVLGHGTPFNLKIDLPCTKINGNPCSCGHAG